VPPSRHGGACHGPGDPKADPVIPMGQMVRAVGVGNGTNSLTRHLPSDGE